MKPSTLVRFPYKTKHTNSKPMLLDKSHPAVVGGRTIFPTTVRRVAENVTVLKSGHNSAKVGKYVTKGAWKGFSIYTLSLEERKTCPRACLNWRDCYGNHMPFAHRYEHGPHLEHKLKTEIAALAAKHPDGFVVRLHILGDFYSIEYVRLWFDLLDTYPMLHIFGYTARLDDDPIGRAISKVRKLCKERFSIRQSGVEAITIAGPLLAPEGIICPAQTGASLCCGTCALCWSAPTKTILFMAH